MGHVSQVGRRIRKLVLTIDIRSFVKKHRNNDNGVDENDDDELCLLFPAEVQLMVGIFLPCALTCTQTHTHTHTHTHT